METIYRPPDRSKYLLAEEIGKLLKAASRLGEREGRFLTFMANTGVRPSEANLVTAGDVHSAENRVRVNTIKQKRAAGERQIYRDVDLSPAFSKEIARWIRPVAAPDVLFRFSRFTMWRIFKRAAAAAGLASSYRLYSLRHSRAIYLLEWTGDLKYTSVQMGHSSINVTSVYLHCLPSRRQEYVSKRLGSFGDLR